MCHIDDDARVEEGTYEGDDNRQNGKHPPPGHAGHLEHHEQVVDGDEGSPTGLAGLGEDFPEADDVQRQKGQAYDGEQDYGAGDE